MIKLILGTFTSIFLMVSIAIIYYWRDIQYDPSSMDLLSYFIVIPLVLSLILLSPYLLYQAYYAYKKHKQQRKTALLEQPNKKIPETNKIFEEFKFLNLNIFSSNALSAFGANESIINALKNFRSPELDQHLTNGCGLPVLSYRIKYLDDVMAQQDEDSDIKEKQGRLQRIQALIQYQLEQQSKILSQLAAHLKQSAFFYDSELAYQYRMHPAWIDPDYQAQHEDDRYFQVEPVPRLNRLNIHILLSDQVLHVWDEHFSQEILLNFMQSLGIISQQIHIQHHFIGQRSSYKYWLNLLSQISAPSHEISLVINVDSEIDQEVLDDKMWLSNDYLAAEFTSSWCVASHDLNINQLHVIKSLKIALNVHDLANFLNETVPNYTEQIQQEQPFVVILDDTTDINAIKKTNQIFVPTLIETHHSLYIKQSLGHTQTLSKIFGFMLGVHFPEELTAMTYSTDQAFTHAFFQTVAE
ncbi:hypothetical protein E0H80_07990 [Acinetobacter sp. ANC 4779]|uniref:hypothetical protein n=1 Tax=Acinetobacter sp. ANC 4779 TaxID=2529848 RepID=UPI00103A23AC|nr:hypothetical protein [Acinetobacter sp. ANC 4779]TCB50756.1 hypothetical protein E0H80_07990 [Acinetobacter sp. ANC 4779]